MSDREDELNNLREEIGTLGKELALEKERNMLLQKRSEMMQEKKAQLEANRKLVETQTKAAAGRRSPLFKFLLDQSQYWTAFESVYKHLDVRDVVILSRTCKDLSTFYSDLLPRKWNVDQRLSQFVADPKGFRSELGQTEALISGSFAIQFFMQLKWPDASLDIFVQEGKNADRMIRYMESQEGYVHETIQQKWDNENEDEDYDEWRGNTLSKITVYVKKTDGRILHPCMKFVITRTFPLYAILIDASFTTLHYNLISWNKAYCQYPKNMGHHMLFTRDPNHRLGGILSRYASRGWKTTELLEWSPDGASHDVGTSLQHRPHEEYQDPCRRVGDRRSWTVNFDVQGIQGSGPPNHALENSTYNLRELSEDEYEYCSSDKEQTFDGLQRFETSALPFHYCTLRYPLTYLDDEWAMFLRNALNKYLSVEIIKCGDTDLMRDVHHWTIQRFEVTCPLLYNVDDWSRPATWDCVDHLVAKLREDHQNELDKKLEEAKIRLCIQREQREERSFALQRASHSETVRSFSNWMINTWLQRFQQPGRHAEWPFIRRRVN